MPFSSLQQERCQSRIQRVLVAEKAGFMGLLLPGFPRGASGYKD